MVLLASVGCVGLAKRSVRTGPRVAEGGVEFSLYAPAAMRVQLAGDWSGNNWARGDGPAGETNVGLMADDDGDGIWKLVVSLEPGRYRYVFYVDEATWRVDPANSELVSGGPAGLASQVVLFRKSGRLELR